MDVEQFNPWKPALQKHSPGLLHPPLTHSPSHTAVRIRMITEVRDNLGCSSCLARSILQHIDHTSPLSIVACNCTHQAVRKCPLGIQICRWLEVRVNQSNRRLTRRTSSSSPTLSAHVAKGPCCCRVAGADVRCCALSIHALRIAGSWTIRRN
jgi:hypothetical protein